MVLLPNSQERKTRRHLIGRWGIAKTGQVSKQGTAEMWERWDGSVDATVYPKALRIRIRADTGADLAAIAEFEAAVREHEMALKTNDMALRARTTKRVNAAKQRLIERSA